MNRALRVVNRIHVTALMAPLQGQVFGLQRSNRSSISAVNREEHPGGADAAEDESVVAHRRLPGERHALRRYRPGKTSRDLLNVTSRRVASGAAREDDVLRVAEPHRFS